VDQLLSPATLAAFTLTLVRAGALVIAAPLLGASLSMGAPKIALTMILATVLFLAGGEPLAQEPAATAFGLLALRELVIGLFLGFLLQLVLLAVRVFGELLGLEMGMQMAAQVDPESGTSLPLLARTYETLLLLGLMSVDGHQWLVRALAASFERAPVGQLRPTTALGQAFLAMFAEMLSAGIALAAPVMVIMSLVSLLIGLLARTVPQINVLELGFSLRVGVALTALLVLSPLLGPLFGGLLEAFERWIALGLDALEA
jgi:flagellar biosynthetic protein FliR